MTKMYSRRWSRQIEALAREISRLALVCDIKIDQPGFAERILRNDESICRRRDKESFRHLRQHLMALYPLEERAIERLGAGYTKKILDDARAAVMAIREAGNPGSTT